MILNLTRTLSSWAQKTCIIPQEISRARPILTSTAIKAHATDPTQTPVEYNTPAMHGYWTVFENDNDVRQRNLDNGSWFIPVDDLNLLVPGDVLYMDHHLAIVNKIIFDEGTRDILTDESTIIEATTVIIEGDDRWQVYNGRNLGFYELYNLFARRRLKPN